MVNGTDAVNGETPNSGAEMSEGGGVMGAGERVDGVQDNVENCGRLGDVDDGVLVRSGRSRCWKEGIERVVGDAEEEIGMDVEEDAVRGEKDGVWREGLVLRAGVEGGGDRDKGALLDGRRVVVRRAGRRGR